LAERGWKAAIGRYEGLWELPVSSLTVPPDELVERYGVGPGLSQALGATGGGQISGVDYDFWYVSEATPAQALATLKYSLDQRLAGNRSPLVLTMHTQYYTPDYPERRAAIRAFVDYALEHPSVRIVSAERLLDWLRKPVPLRP